MAHDSWLTAHGSRLTAHGYNHQNMRFGAVPIEAAVGKVLGHNVAGRDGERIMRKGKPLLPADIERLRAAGLSSVYVAELGPDDIGEDAAARQIAAVISGRNLSISGAAGGRVNLISAQQGVLRVDVARLHQINEIEGLTLASLQNHATVERKSIVATIKVIPFALPANEVAAAIAIANTPMIWLDPLPARRVTLIVSGSPAARDRIVRDFSEPIRTRLEALGSQLTEVHFVPLEDEHGEMALAQLLTRSAQNTDQCNMVILAGDTAIMDRHDIAPRAIERAGGRIVCFGAPVDPGNLLLIAQLGPLPILGAPGCVRSRKLNVVDWVLPRLLVGDQLSRSDIASLGAGGLLEDVRERPMPRLG